MIISLTGHRQVFNKYYPHKVWNPICEEVVSILERLKPVKIISGGALGFDSLAIDAAIALGIPYDIAAPFKNHEINWNFKSKERYKNYLTKANNVVIVSIGDYEPYKMQVRNEYMVDNSDIVLALYDGRGRSGTLNCISYAKNKNKEILIINPKK